MSRIPFISPSIFTFWPFFQGEKKLHRSASYCTAYHKEIERRTASYQQEIEELRLKGELFLNKVIEYYQSKQYLK